MIRKLLLCGGVHGSRAAIEWMKRVAAERRPDAVLFAGGILSHCRPASGTRTAWSLSLPEAQFGDEFMGALGDLRIFSAIIPGPAGEPLEEFLRLGMRAELTHPALHVVHGTLVETDNLAVSGVGGTIAETQLIGLDTYTRPMAEYFLRSLVRSNKPRKALLLPNPPPGLLGGAEGNSLVADLIDSIHPDLCVVAGGSGRRGQQRVGHTLVVNPGRLCDGSAAWLDWARAGEASAEFLDAGRAVGPRKAPTTDEIRDRAYAHWLAAGKPQDSSDRFWVEAEKELQAAL